MTTPAQALRGAIEACHRAGAAARLERWRDATEDHAPGAGEDAAWLASERADEALEEALDSGEVDADEHAWLVRQRAYVARARRLDFAHRRLREDLGAAALPGGEPLHLADELGALALSDDPLHRGETGLALARAVEPAARRFVAAHLDVERIGRPTLLLDVGGVFAIGTPVKKPEPDAFVAVAVAFLHDTADAAEDAVRWHTRGLGAGAPLPWHALVRGLRARKLDASTRANARFHHAAAAFRRLGFEDDMGARMRAEVDSGGAGPFATLACLHVPRDVRVAQPPGDWGVLSDVYAADGVGQALGVALALAPLPPELRWPVGAGVPGALGALASGLWANRTHLVRLQGLSRPEAERVARVAATVVLLNARVWAALAAAPTGDAPETGSRMEQLSSVLGEALRCDLPPALASLLGADIVLARAKAREHLAGLALAIGLRERYDEDWFLNRRTEEPIRGAGQRGNRLTPEDFCAEFATDLAAAAPRVVELVA